MVPDPVYALPYLILTAVYPNWPFCPDLPALSRPDTGLSLNVVSSMSPSHMAYVALFT